MAAQRWCSQMNPSPVELPELLQRLKANCLEGVRDGPRLRVQCEMVLCDVSEPAGPGVHLYECWTERRNGDGVVKKGKGRERMRMVSSQQQMRRESLK